MPTALDVSAPAVVNTGTAAISSVNAWAAVAFGWEAVALAWAVTVNEYEPATVGVPDSNPAPLSDRPIGTAPLVTEYEAALVHDSCSEYADAAALLVSAPPFCGTHESAPAIVSVNACVAVALVARPVARMLQGEPEDGVVGVPDSKPELLRVMPAGSEPSDTEKVVDRPVLVISCSEYGAPVTQLASVPEVVHTGTAAIRSEKDCALTADAALPVAVTVQ